MLIDGDVAVIDARGATLYAVRTRHRTLCSANMGSRARLMNDTLQTILEHAMHLGRAGRLTEAAELMQRELGWAAPRTAPAAATDTRPPVIDADFEATEPPATSASGQFLHGRYSHGNETRDYRLYRPAHLRTAPPLIVMLHGCQQDGEELARLTRCNQWADAQGCIVLYPSQSRLANPTGCWNWFAPEHQRADQGEAAVLAALTREIAARHGADPQRLYIAGLSAGGAMALNLVATHPGLFAAVAVHSGLPYGLAHDQLSALTLMHQGPSGGHVPLTLAENGVPIIVFQGDADLRVNPLNASWIIEQALNTADTLHQERETRRAAGGLDVTRTRYLTASGTVCAELWMIHGGGHGWFGGDPAAAFAEPKGPDATEALLRFFLAEH